MSGFPSFTRACWTLIRPRLVRFLRWLDGSACTECGLAGAHKIQCSRQETHR